MNNRSPGDGSSTITRVSCSPRSNVFGELDAGVLLISVARGLADVALGAVITGKVGKVVLSLNLKQIGTSNQVTRHGAGAVNRVSCLFRTADTMQRPLRVMPTLWRFIPITEAPSSMLTG